MSKLPHLYLQSAEKLQSKTSITAEQYRKKIKRPEKDVQKAICEYLTVRRIPFSITDASGVLNLQGKRVASKARKGWPDLTAVLPRGKALFIECKSSVGRVRPEQEAMHELLREQGAVVIVARSLEDVERFVEGYLIAFINPTKNWRHGDGRPGSR